MPAGKVLNLKQMAQTIEFLTKHNLLDYAVLKRKSGVATTRATTSCLPKSRQRKSAWQRSPYCVPHIVNYAKTRETYVAYRKAGYSKKFREEHEADILLHQAAKNAFEDLGVKKAAYCQKPTSGIRPVVG